MSRWASVFSRGGGRRAPAHGTPSADGGSRQTSAVPPVEDVDGVLLLRSVDDDFPSLAELAEVAYAVRNGGTEEGEEGEEGTVTVLVGAPAQDGAGAAEHWGRLAALLDRLREKGTTRVRLVLSGAGHDRPDAPSVARRIADSWEMEVVAPDGSVLITPGGALFVQDSPGPVGRSGWWHFAPATDPRLLGLRAPVPAWQEAFARLPERTSGGSVVYPIPAGVALSPAEAPRPGAGDLPFAVPVHPRRPVVLVGAPYAEDVAAEEVAAVLAALPVTQRSQVRLAPGGRRDLLRLGQSVADMLGGEVEVLTGIPLATGDMTAGGAVRPTLIGAGGELTWQPLVTAVMCAPAGAGPPAPRPLHSHSPLPGVPLTAEGTVRLTGRWEAAPTRAGVVVVPAGAPRPPVAGAPVDPDTLAVELGLAGEPLDDSLLPALNRLLTDLGPQLRARATLVVCGRLTLGELALRELAARHKVGGIRYVMRLAMPPRTRPAAPSSPAATRSATQSTELTAPRPPARNDTQNPARTSTQSAQSEPDGAGRQGTGVPPMEAATVSSVLFSGPAPVPAASPAKPADSGAEERGTAQDTAAESTPEPTPATGTGVPRPVDARSRPAPEKAGDPGATVSVDVPSSRTPAPEPLPEPEPAPEPLPEPEPEPAPVPEPAPEPRPEPASVSPSEPEPLRAAPRMSVPAVPAPLAPGHVSSESERAAFRALAAGEWEHHSAAVIRWLTRMPALRGQELEAAREDLVAVHAYLTAGEDTELHYGALAREMRAGEEKLLPYAACLASALRRLPSYRGVAVRGADAPENDSGVPGTGTLLVEPGPVSTLALPPARPDGPPVRYAIWSVTGRKVRHLMDAPGGTPQVQEEIVFAPGTGFRVLGTRELHGSPVLLLRELPGSAVTWTDSVEELSGLDRSALDRLDKALGGAFPDGRGTRWPERCTGPVGPVY